MTEYYSVLQMWHNLLSWCISIGVSVLVLNILIDEFFVYPGDFFSINS